MPGERSQQNACAGTTCEDRTGRPGILYVVGVPIGHFDDITLRALAALSRADLIASENPAATQRLLSHHGIDAALTSYGPTNLKEKVAVLIQRLQHGTCVALVSDCGSPVIADPGSLLVDAAHSRGIRVVSVPGPSALTAAVAISGLSGESFFFEGLVPRTRPVMKRWLKTRLNGRATTVAFCNPRLLALTLSAIHDIAPRRLIVLACDLTRPGELIIRGTARQVQHKLALPAATANVTLILSGRKTVTRNGGNRRMRRS